MTLVGGLRTVFGPVVRDLYVLATQHHLTQLGS
jgi:hypothetical protein